jgi:hypothetical protein
VTHFICGNFVAPRTLSVNGTTEDANCAIGGPIVLPAPLMGGFCFQVGAGDYSFAYFTTY